MFRGSATYKMIVKANRVDSKRILMLQILIKRSAYVHYLCYRYTYPSVKLIAC